MNPIILQPLDIAVAASLLAFDALISIVLRLRLHDKIVIASVRMVIQLVAIGYLLKLVFSIHQPAVTALLIVIMVVIAAREAAARPERKLKHAAGFWIGLASIASATVLTALFALTTALRPHRVAVRYLGRSAFGRPPGISSQP